MQFWDDHFMPTKENSGFKRSANEGARQIKNTFNSEKIKISRAGNYAHLSSLLFFFFTEELFQISLK